MDYGLGFLGEYITAAELVGKTPTLTINKVTLEKVESLKSDDDAGGKMKDRIVVYFAEGKSGRGWLLNRTNAECLKEMWGRETNEWLGHKVTLFVSQVRVGRKMEPGIRVKGSPELTEPRQFELKLPRKKPILTTLVPTGKEPKRTEKNEAPDDTPSLDECISMYDAGQQEEAIDLARGLSAEDQSAFDSHTESATQ
jgi:hypothetical protein